MALENSGELGLDCGLFSQNGGLRDIGGTGAVGEVVAGGHTGDYALKGLTASQAKFMQEHRERRQRIASRAVQDTPVVCLSASARAKAFQPAIVAEPEPDPPKRHWFWMISDFPTVTPPIRKIQHTCCEFYDIDFVEMISIRRQAILVRARQVGMFLCKTLTTRSLPEIGRKFGNRDHTTVLYAVNKIAKLESQDNKLAGEINSLRERIRSAA